MQKYIIYQISKEGCDYIYIGSTKNFTRRKCAHKRLYNDETKKSYNLLLYKTIRENGGWENWNMIPIEEYECDTRIQALIREQYWIDLKQANLNSNKAYITVDQINEYNKQYYEVNKNQLIQHQKQYREAIL